MSWSWSWSLSGRAKFLIRRLLGVWIIILSIRVVTRRFVWRKKISGRMLAPRQKSHSNREGQLLESWRNPRCQLVCYRTIVTGRWVLRDSGLLLVKIFCWKQQQQEQQKSVPKVSDPIKRRKSACFTFFGEIFWREAKIDPTVEAFGGSFRSWNVKNLPNCSVF